MDFAQKISFLIERDGVSRGKLARAVGVHTSTVTNWISGKAPKLESLVKVSEFFDVPVSYLTGETDDPSDRSKTHWAELAYGQKEKPTLQMEDEPFEGYSDLTEEEKKQVRDYAAFLLASRHKQ